ncbi:MAG: hypothetical protein HY290_00675, partial [Planctomycetia bacterium]|nr:hypothetical protein [Planctomycetia bacterium]
MCDSTVPATILCKIGGSLLDLPGLASVISGILCRNAPSPTLIVPGGGAAADAVRTWDTVHGLADEAAHELALAAMDLTGDLLAKLVPGMRQVCSIQQAQRAASDGVTGLLCAGCFVNSAEAQGHPPLERSWRVTSDSIAAWTAQVLGGASLILVKSVSLPPGITLADAAQIGLVDEAFPQLAQRLPLIGWINARGPSPAVETWILTRSAG